MSTSLSPLVCLILQAISADSVATTEPVAVTKATEATRLETVVAVGNRREQRLSEVAGTVSVITQSEQAGHLVQNLTDLVRYEPGVHVVEDATRFGAQGFSIRGLDGNRVLMRVDGVPVRDAFSVGSFSRSSRAAVDTELLSRTELLRGPASTIHGSSALAGVVDFHTVGADDILSGKDQGLGIGARSTLLSRDQSWSKSAFLADRFEQSEWVVGYVQRTRAERDTNPRPGGLPANPQSATEQAGLLKWQQFGLPIGDLSVGVDVRSADTSTDVQSLVHGPSQYASTEAMLAHDEEQDLRIRAALALPAARFGLDSLDASLAIGRSKVDQRTLQWRAAEPPRTQRNRRDRRFVFDESMLAFNLIGDRQWDQGFASHAVAFGLDLSEARGREARDGAETNLVTGASTNVVLGEVFPLRDFPETVSREAALFVQDDLQITDAWTVIPGLRYEWFAVNADPDALYHADNPNQRVSDLSDSALTGKLGVIWQASDQWQGFLQYAEGFRAPPASDLNLGFNLPAFNYVALPNPDLRPEHSRGLELGARWSGEHSSTELVFFESHYRDLIESRVNLGRNAEGQLVFQSQNRAKARIRGLELRANADLPWQGFSTFANLAVTEGKDRVRDQRLNTIDPAKLSLGLTWQSANLNHRVELIGTAIARQDDIAPSATAAFESPGTGLVDLYWSWQLSPQWRVDASANNLTDRRWWAWSSVRGMAANAREIDLATQPGRTYGLQLAWHW
ncbi:TonB-dependent hemoglobin/transferrin/lactoferrin family receptor [Ahniella affigens]|nr:TonB-dependent hemoglobin/transferrin/lactoferrin family receptor [Ahniella affigens]